MSEFFPTSRSEVARLLETTRSPISVRGTGSRGLATDAPTILKTTALDSIVNLDVEEQVLTADAGVRLETISRALEETGLFLAPTFCHPPVGTLGGLLSDPREFPTHPRLGRVRDMILGLEAVRGDGTPFKAGGRVVKNVTGYDLTRLLTGARGRWGVVTRVHWRLQPMPGAVWTGRWRFDDFDELWKALDAIRRLPFEPLLVAVYPRDRVVTLSECGTDSVCEAHSRRWTDILGNPMAVTSEFTLGDIGVHRYGAPYSHWRTLIADDPERWQVVFPNAHYGTSDEKSVSPPVEPHESLRARVRSAWDPLANLQGGLS